MSRPKRAAATRAVAQLVARVSGKDDDDSEHPNNNHHHSHHQNPASPEPTTPTRPLRRVSLRPNRQGVRDLARRRAMYERIAAHHISAAKASPSAPDDFSHHPPPSSDIQHSSSRLPTSNSDDTTAPPTSLHSTSDSDLSNRTVAPPLTGDSALPILEHGDHAPGDMRTLLRQLQSVLNSNDPAPEPEPSRRGLDLRQPIPADDFRGLAERLANPRFMSHTSPPVRLLTACCLAEVFRIVAPDPPLEMRKLNPVCSLFIDQLAVLAASSDGLEAFRFSLLEQLATVKTLVIFSDDQDVVANVFACFYAVSRAHQSEKVRQYFAEILESLLEEAEAIDKDVLDALIAPLVPALSYSESAIALAEKVVQDAAKCIQVPLCNIFNASIRALRGTHPPSPAKRITRRPRKSPVKKQSDVSGIDLDDLSEHHEHFSDLLIAINRIAPDILIYVVPNLEDRLRSPDVAIRHGAVSLLARLFTSRTDMSRSYPTLYSEFLARHLDAAPEIRVEVVHAMGELLVTDHNQTEHLDRMLRDRFLDCDEKVRIAAVQAVGKAGDHASDETIHRLVTRIQDRKASVRSEALSHVILLCTETGKTQPTRQRLASGGIFEPQDSIDLSEEFRQAEGNQMFSSDQEPASQENALEERMLRWSFLPNALLEAHVALRSAGDFITAAEIEKIVFERICQPAVKSDDPETMRLGFRRFAIFLAHLNQTSFSTFRILVNERTRARKLLREIARLRLLVRTQPADKEKDSLKGKESTKEKDLTKEEEPSKENVKPRQWPARAPTPSHGYVEEAVVLSRRFALLFRGLAGNSGSIQDMCKTIASSVDLNIYKCFARAFDGDLTNADYETVAQDALSRIGSKSPTGKLLQAYVLPKCRPGVLSSACINIACESATSEANTSRSIPLLDSEASDSESRRDPTFMLSGILRYLDVLRRFSTESLEGCIVSVRRLFSTSIRDENFSADVVVCGLRLACVMPELCKKHLQRADVWNILETHMLNERVLYARHAIKLSKWASRLAIVLSDDVTGKNRLENLCKRLSAQFDRFTGLLEGIVAPVSAMSQLAKHAPELFKEFALQTFDFMRTLLSGSFNSQLVFPSSGPASHGDNGNDVESPEEHRDSARASETRDPEMLSRDAPDFPYHAINSAKWRCVAELLSRAVKVLVYSLEHVDAREEFPNVVSILVGGLDGDDVLGLKRNAELLGDDELGDDQSTNTKTNLSSVRAFYRLRSACGLIFLARHRRFFREFTPDMLSGTVAAVHDEDPGTRLGFARYLYNGALKKRLPLRWIAALALMATDAKAEHVAKVKSMMTHVFHQRRLVFEKARRERNAASSQFLPEVTITDLIWILAHQRDIEKDQKKGFVWTSKCLELMLNCLLDSKEYEGLVNEYIESVTIAEDATEPADGGSRVFTERMVEISQIAGNILKKRQAGKKWLLSEHPHKIMLSRDLFRVPDRNEEMSGVVRPSIVDVARKYDDLDGKRLGPMEVPGEKVLSKTATPIASSSDRRKKMRNLKLPDEDEESPPKAVVEISPVNARHSTGSSRNSTGRRKRRRSPERSERDSGEQSTPADHSENSQVEKMDITGAGGDTVDEIESSKLCVKPDIADSVTRKQKQSASSGESATKKQKKSAPSSPKANVVVLRRRGRRRRI